MSMRKAPGQGRVPIRLHALLRVQPETTVRGRQFLPTRRGLLARPDAEQGWQSDVIAESAFGVSEGVIGMKPHRLMRNGARLYRRHVRRC